MNRATRITVSTFGAIMGLAGIEHGVGEVLQGNRVPNSLFILSWPDAPFFRGVGGEPAMTVIPNLLITGILAILVSLLYIVWVVALPHTKRAGLVLILLSIVMLLVGGGLFPPALAAIMGMVATRINAPLAWWRTRFSSGVRRSIGSLWRGACVFCLAAWLFLMPGLNILTYYLALDSAALTIATILVALGSLALTILTGLAHDASVAL